MVLPAPGIRDFYLDSSTAAGVSDSSISRKSIFKDIISSVGGGNGVINRLLEQFKSFNGTGAGVGSINKAAIFVRNFVGTGVSDSDLIRSVIFVRDFIGTGIATIRPRITLDWEDLPNAGAGNQIVNVFRPIFVFED